MDTLGPEMDAMKSMGLVETMTDPYYWVVSGLLGLFGFAAFKYGKSTSSIKATAIGGVMMAIPVFIYDTPTLGYWLIGLTAVLIVPYP